MKLHPDWKKIAKRSWNMRIVVLATLLSGAEALMPFLPALLDVPLEVMAYGTPILLMAALVARLVAQKNLSGEASAD